MLVIAGLGNPGLEYKNHRHNIGFMVVETIYRSCNFSLWKEKFYALNAEGRIEGKRILLVKPQTWMNCSGQSLRKILSFYKLSVDNLVVIHDDLDLPPGRVRVKKGGSAGGHNGIKSINCFCGNAYRRVRLGIGHPGDKKRVLRYVLGNFSQVEKFLLKPLLATFADYINLLVLEKDLEFIQCLEQAVWSKANELSQ